MRNIFTVLLITILGSCASKKEAGRESPKENIRIEKNENAYIGQNYAIKLYFNQRKYSIVKAYFDCDKERVIDPESLTISGCHKRLEVKNDTVSILFVPTQEGEFNFHDITLLCEKKNHSLFTIDTTFHYSVQNKP